LGAACEQEDVKLCGEKKACQWKPTNCLGGDVWVIRGATGKGLIGKSKPAGSRVAKKREQKKGKEEQREMRGRLNGGLQVTKRVFLSKSKWEGDCDKSYEPKRGKSITRTSLLTEKGGRKKKHAAWGHQSNRRTRAGNS